MNRWLDDWMYVEVFLLGVLTTLVFILLMAKLHS